MIDRASSDTIGIALLTAMITLTVSVTGVVVMGEWQSDLDSDPVADIEVDASPINLTVEHRGGSTLYPQNTSVYLANEDEEIELQEPLGPGSSLFREFDRLDDPVEFVVVYDPTESVIHSETLRVDNPAEGLTLEVSNWTQPTYLLEGHPANYSVKLNYKYGAPTDLTADSDVTIADESIVDLDESNSMMTGQTTSSTNGTAEARDFTGETEIVVLDSDPPVQAETNDVNTTGITSAELNGELVDLGGLPETDLIFNYWPENRTMVGDPVDNSDKIIADGDEYQVADNPEISGYAIDNYWHDNEPYEPGETRTHYINESGADPNSYRGTLRDSPQLVANDSVDNIPEVDDEAVIYYHPENEYDNETFQVDVTYAADGSEFRINVVGEPESSTWDGLEAYDELYFSGFQSFGSASMYVIGVDSLPAESTRTTVETGVEGPQTYSQEVEGLYPDRTYNVSAYTEQDIGGKTVTDSGEERQFTISGPSVETKQPDISGVRSANLTGNLTALGEMDAVDLFFDYWPENRTPNKDPTDNGDKIISDGEYKSAEQLEISGYSLGNNYWHDNEPYEPGESRTHYINESGADANSYRGTLRDSPQLTPNNSVNSIDEVSDEAVIYYHPEDEYPEETFQVNVKYAHDGSEFIIDVPGGPTRTWDGLEEYDELYFSGYQSFGSDSYKLVGVDPLPTETETIDKPSVGTTGRFQAEIDGLDPERPYRVEAYTEQEINGVTVADRGEDRRFRTEGPVVETNETNVTTVTRSEVAVDLADPGDLNSADLFVDYWPVNRTVNKGSLDNGDKIIAAGDYYEEPAGYAFDGGWIHDNEPIERGESRTYYINESGYNGHSLRGSLRESEQTVLNYSINSIDELGDEEGIYGGFDNYETIELTVHFHDNFDEFQFYVDGSYHTSWGGLEDYDELYLSMFQSYGNSGENSLRLVGAGPLASEQQTDTVDIGASAMGSYTTEIDGLYPDHEYRVQGYTEQDIDGLTVDDFGDEIPVSTTGPVVETNGRDITGARSVSATGELVGLGDLSTADLYVDYWPENRTFAENASNNSDKLIADGDFMDERPSIPGYVHNRGGYIHDNDPFEPGETRSYYMIDTGDASTGRFQGSLRDSEQTVANRSVANIDEVPEDRRIEHGVPDNEVFELRVEYDDDGRVFDFYINGEHTGETWGGLEDYHELYLSTRDYKGGFGDNSLRLIAVDRLPSEDKTVTANTSVSTLGEFDATLDAVYPDRFSRAEAYTEQHPDGVPVIDRGESTRFRTEGPTVETLSVESTGSDSISVEGELTDLGDLDSADLRVNYWPDSRTFNNDSTDNSDDVISDGGFDQNPEAGYAHGPFVHDNNPFEPGDSRTYTFNETDDNSAQLWASLRDSEHTTPNSPINSIDAVEGDIEQIRKNVDDDPFRVRVKYAADGSEFRFYYKTHLALTIDGLESYGNLYFSSRQRFGGTLRTLDIDETTADDIQTVTHATDISSTGTFSEEITGLQSDTVYEATPIANQEIGGLNVSGSGETRETRTVSP